MDKNEKVVGICYRCGERRVIELNNPPLCECCDPDSPFYIPDGECEEKGYSCPECLTALWNSHSLCPYCLPHIVVGKSWQVLVG